MIFYSYTLVFFCFKRLRFKRKKKKSNMTTQITDELDPSSVAVDLYDENEDSDDGLDGHASEETYDDIYLDTANSSSHNLNKDNNTSNRVEDFRIIHSSGDFKLRRTLTN